jgi:hypothetical protein
VSLVTITGADGVALDVMEARPTFPLTGAWHVDAFVLSDADLTGAVAIDLGGDLTLRGTVIVEGTYAEALHLRILAGAGGWSTPCTPKFYQGATLGMILSELLAQGGETLSATSDARARGTLVRQLATTSGTVGANVLALMAYAPAGTSWRFLPDGSFWIGPETWPAFSADYVIVGEEPRERRMDIGSLSPALISGQSLIDQAGNVVHVNRVESAISGDGIRSRAWLQP